MMDCMAELSRREVLIGAAAVAAVGALPAAAGMPGTVEKWPAGFIPANGQGISRAAYPELFRHIGEMWGAGDGKTTFNVPPGLPPCRRGATLVICAQPASNGFSVGQMLRLHTAFDPECNINPFQIAPEPYRAGFAVLDREPKVAVLGDIIEDVRDGQYYTIAAAHQALALANASRQ